MDLTSQSPITDTLAGCSYGTSGLVRTLMKLSSQPSNPRRPIVDTWVINAMTIYDSVYDKNDSPDALVRQYNHDLETLVSWFGTYTQSLGPIPDKPNIIVFVPSYHLVPEFYLRPESNTNQQVYSTFNKRIASSFRPEEPTRLKYGDVDIHFVVVGYKQIPHVELRDRYFKAMNQDAGRIVNRYTWITSHFPIDYHFIKDMGDRGRIFDRHTGNLRTYSEIGKKVFGKEGIPFNTVTHLAFGDKILLKSLLNRRDRKRFFEDGLKNKWYLKTKAQLLTIFSHVLPKNWLESKTLKL